MRWRGRVLAAIATAVAACACSTTDDSTPQLRMVGGEWFELVGVAPDAVRAFAHRAAAERCDVFAVRVASADAGAPPMLGGFSIWGDVIRFSPRFPLAAGVRYRVIVDGSYFGGDETITKVFTMPASSAPLVRVQQIYPTASELPENLLRFYVHFSGRVARGEVYRNVTLRDDTAGTLVELPFLEIAEELWNPSGTRLTLLIDPGRIKSKLRPRIESGPVFRAQHSYTLKIDGKCMDAEGRPLAHSYVKRFRIGAVDTTQPDPNRWTVSQPQAGTIHELEVRFPEPLDHALLQHMIEVIGPQGQRVSGTVEVLDHETRWRFRPTQSWARGDHYLRIDTELEDRVGNSIRSPFEVDVFGVTRRKLEKRTVRLALTLR